MTRDVSGTAAFKDVGHGGFMEDPPCACSLSCSPLNVPQDNYVLKTLLSPPRLCRCNGEG